MAKPLRLEDLPKVLRDAERVVDAGVTDPELRFVAYREVLRELLDNEYTDDADVTVRGV